MLEATTCSGCGKACSDPYEEDGDWIVFDPGSDIRIVRTGSIPSEILITGVEYFCCPECVAKFIGHELGLRGYE